MASASSSAIRHLAYNPGRQELHVFFRGGGDYTYFDVPLGEYEALLEAPSKGASSTARSRGTTAAPAAASRSGGSRSSRAGPSAKPPPSRGALPRGPGP
jgi:hypothetical protein